MIALVVAVGFEYAVSAAAIGAALFALLRRTGRRWSPRAVWVVLFLVFGVLDTYWLPIARGLDISISIGNPAVAEALGISGSASLNRFLDVGAVDVVVWVAQALLGTVVGAWLVQQPNVQAS